MARKIRVLMRELPELVRGLLSHALSDQPDIELVHRALAPTSVDTSAPDVVVVMQGGEGVENVRPILFRWPKAKVLMMSVDGRQAWLFQFRPHRTQLPEMSPAELTVTIRDAVRHQWT